MPSAVANFFQSPEVTSMTDSIKHSRVEYVLPSFRYRAAVPRSTSSAPNIGKRSRCFEATVILTPGGTLRLENHNVLLFDSGLTSTSPTAFPQPSHLTQLGFAIHPRSMRAVRYHSSACSSGSEPSRHSGGGKMYLTRRGRQPRSFTLPNNSEGGSEPTEVVC